MHGGISHAKLLVVVHVHGFLTLEHKHFAESSACVESNSENLHPRKFPAYIGPV